MMRVPFVIISSDLILEAPRVMICKEVIMSVRHVIINYELIMRLTRVMICRELIVKVLAL